MKLIVINKVACESYVKRRKGRQKIIFVENSVEYQEFNLVSLSSPQIFKQCIYRVCSDLFNKFLFQEVFLLDFLLLLYIPNDT